MPTQEDNQQRKREAKALLEGFWPLAFSFSAPKPLKVGILDEMVNDAAARGLPFDHTLLKEAVKQYTLRYVYQRALAKGKVRYGLQGEESGTVTEEQKARAVDDLKQRDKKRRNKIKALKAVSLADAGELPKA